MSARWAREGQARFGDEWEGLLELFPNHHRGELVQAWFPYERKRLSFNEELKRIYPTDEQLAELRRPIGLLVQMSPGWNIKLRW